MDLGLPASRRSGMTSSERASSPCRGRKPGMARIGWDCALRIAASASASSAPGRSSSVSGCCGKIASSLFSATRTDEVPSGSGWSSIFFKRAPNSSRRVVQAADRLGQRALQRALEALGQFHRLAVIVERVAMLAGLRRKSRLRLDIGARNLRAGAAIGIERDQKIMALFDALLVGLGMAGADFADCLVIARSPNGATKQSRFGYAKRWSASLHSQ